MKIFENESSFLIRTMSQCLGAKFQVRAKLQSSLPNGGGSRSFCVRSGDLRRPGLRSDSRDQARTYMSVYFCILQKKVLLNHSAQDSSLCVTRLGGSQVDKRVYLDLCPRHFQMLRLTIDAKRWSHFTGCVNVILSEAVCVRLPLMHPARPI